MFDQLGDTSSTGTLQASSAQRIPRRAAALLEKMDCCSRGPWSAFPWSWRPPRSSTGKTKVVGLVELSMPGPLHHAHHDGITSYHLALCDPPAGGPTYCRPLSGCRLPEILPRVEFITTTTTAAVRAECRVAGGAFYNKVTYLSSQGSRKRLQTSAPKPKPTCTCTTCQAQDTAALSSTRASPVSR